MLTEVHGTWAPTPVRLELDKDRVLTPSGPGGVVDRLRQEQQEDVLRRDLSGVGHAQQVDPVPSLCGPVSPQSLGVGTDTVNDLFQDP